MRDLLSHHVLAHTARQTPILSSDSQNNAQPTPFCNWQPLKTATRPPRPPLPPVPREIAAHRRCQDALASAQAAGEAVATETSQAAKTAGRTATKRSASGGGWPWLGGQGRRRGGYRYVVGETFFGGGMSRSVGAMVFQMCSCVFCRFVRRIVYRTLIEICRTGVPKRSVESPNM